MNEMWGGGGGGYLRYPNAREGASELPWVSLGLFTTSVLSLSKMAHDSTGGGGL